MNRKIWAVAIGGLLTVGALSGCQEDVPEAGNVSSEVGAEIGTTAEPTAAEAEAATEPVTEPEPEVETVTETATETVTAEPEVVAAPEPEPESFADEDINRLALEIVWESLPLSEQDDVCWGMDIDEDMMLDAFMEGAGDSFSRTEARDFFREVC